MSPATQQHDDLFAALHVVDAVAWAVVDPQVRHALANRFHIARISRSKADEALDDPAVGALIPQMFEPFVEDIAMDQPDHM